MAANVRRLEFNYDPAACALHIQTPYYDNNYSMIFSNLHQDVFTYPGKGTPRFDNCKFGALIFTDPDTDVELRNCAITTLAAARHVFARNNCALGTVSVTGKICGLDSTMENATGKRVFLITQKQQPIEPAIISPDGHIGFKRVCNRVTLQDGNEIVSQVNEVTIDQDLSVKNKSSDLCCLVQ